MYVLNPDPYSLPAYRIGPFTTRDLSRNHNLPLNNRIEGYFEERFGSKAYQYTVNGRHAIEIALSSLSLKENDEVAILTTSGNYYISSCVTASIEKYCKWSRSIGKKTKAIFVNHEFGYPFAGLVDLRKYNLPIIEDCAGSFFSKGKFDIGEIGDFVVYSFPKMFQIQIGGLLVQNNHFRSKEHPSLESNLLQYIKNVLSDEIMNKDKIIESRIQNYSYIRNKFAQIGYLERFPLEKGIVPGVFMFKTEGKNIDLPELKKFYYAHGVQCSVFYGEEAFFIPVHQALVKDDLDYFFEVFSHFIKTEL